MDDTEAEPTNLRYVGPVFEEDDTATAWDPPWPLDHSDPLVVVGLGSSYMHHEAAVERAGEALDGLPVRAVITTGFGLDPDEIRVPPEVLVRRYIPHVALMPHASLVVTHGGMGTVLAATAYGVPMLCMPLGRDQPEIAARVEALGAGRTIHLEAPVEEIRSAISDALESDELRAGARRMAEVIAGYEKGARAIEELEGLLPTG